MRKYAVRFAVAAAALATLVVLADVLRIWTFREPFVGKVRGRRPGHGAIARQQRDHARRGSDRRLGRVSGRGTRVPGRRHSAGCRRAGASHVRPHRKRGREERRPEGQGSQVEALRPDGGRIQPGVTAFSGATNQTASRTTAMLVDPDCGANKCRVWVGASGGGVWRTDNALAKDPDWKQLGAGDLDQTSVGTLAFDPTDKKGNTIYLGTGEANRCSSGCEAGVGIYKSTDSGENWKKLDDACVSNATYPCVNAGQQCVPRPRDPLDRDRPGEREPHLRRVGAGRPRALARDRQRRHDPPRAGREPAGALRVDRRRRDVHDGLGRRQARTTRGSASFGVTDVGLDPLNPDVVYVAAFDAGLWRRDAGAAQTAFTRSSRRSSTRAPGIDRTMFALTVKNGHTRIYLTEGTQTGGGQSPTIRSPRTSGALDNANQPAATLLASQPAARTAPDPATHTFPATYTGWQNLTSKTTGNPYFATDDFCTAAVLVRPERLHAGRHARHGLRDRVEPVRRAAVQHERRRLRQRPLQRPRGPLLRHRRRPGRRANNDCARSPTCPTTRRSTTRRGAPTRRTSTTAA